MLDIGGYDQSRAEQKQRRGHGDRQQLGIGASSYVEITAIEGGGEFGSVEVLADGSVVGRTGSTPYGRGHDTAWAMLIGARLGVAVGATRIVHGDTAEIPTSGITGSSRSAQLAGSAIVSASDRLVALDRERAGQLLEAAATDVVLDESGTVGSTPAAQNAIVDGVRHIDMPCTPERVWRAINAANP